MRQLEWRGALAVAAWLAISAAGASAQVTTHDPASVLVFPKVIVDGSWETAIQISNIANRPTYAICYYVSGGLTFPEQPPGPSNPPLWAEVDFNLFLVRQQPTQWVVSRGRIPDVLDATCNSPDDDCDGTGLDPGRVPPVGTAFTGELLCYETDASGAPWSGNALIGHATLKHVGSGEVVKYPAVGALGFETNDADGTLCLGGEAGESCPIGEEYGGCPLEWIVSHPADFDDRPVDGDASRTSVTIAPCGHDFVRQSPKQLTLQLLVTNEFELAFSATTTVTCWADLALEEISAIFSRDILGGDWVQTRLRSASSTPLGFTIVQQTERNGARPPTLMAVATVPHQGILSPGSDIIAVPEESIR